MNAQPCLPQEILEVNKNKEYTLISTELLESVLTDTRLNAQASKLWQILFNKARYNPNFEVKISYSYLAKKLGKSTRTIARYTESLQNTGYLIVKHNFDKKGGQRPSTIAVRVPTVSIEHAKKKKDRVNKKCSNNNETLLTINKNTYKKPKEDCMGKNPVTTSQSDFKTPIVLCETIHPIDDIKIPDYPFEENGSKKCDIESKHIPLPSKEILPHQITKQDKNDRGGYDINVLQKNNNKKEINKNNNLVVSFFQKELSITDITNEISTLEKQLFEGNKKLIAIKNHSLLYDQIKDNSQIEATLHLTRLKLERIQNEMNEKTTQEQAYSNLNNPKFMLNKKGERTLPSFTFKRLVKSLKCYGYRDNVLHVLINEIVFEVRFGSLVHCNRTKMPLSFDNAINIALKLIREKRWSTPILFKNLGEII